MIITRPVMLNKYKKPVVVGGMSKTNQWRITDKDKKKSYKNKTEKVTK